MGGGSFPGGGVVLALVVLLCAASGTTLVVLARRRSRRDAPTPEDRRRALGDAAGADGIAEGGVALLLFSRASCPRCEDTREVITGVAAEHAGVQHREVDVADRRDLVAALGVRTTPTVVVVDASGTELLRVAGVPRREDLAAALAPHLS